MQCSDQETDGTLNPGENEQDARDAASHDRVAEKEEAFKLESSGVAAGRIERFGVGPNSKAQAAAAVQRSQSGSSFHMAAMAQAYSQPVTFSAGGRDVSMSLGDMRTVASDRYNHYANQTRDLRAQGASPEKIKAAQQRRNAYGDLLRMTDAVAAGKMSPAELADHIRENDLGQEVVDTALAHPDIEVSDAAPQTAEAVDAGVHTHQSADELNADFVGSFFGPS